MKHRSVNIHVFKYAFALACVMGATACKTSDLSPAAANVAAGRSAAPTGCKPLKYLTGKGGGTFGGGFISNEDLIEYAMNDLRNQAAELGGNYIQHDPPQLGSGDGTTTSVTITGTAYQCPKSASSG
jgi:hypothetical protein